MGDRSRTEGDFGQPRPRLRPAWPNAEVPSYAATMKKVAVLTSGGDAPGMNGAIRAVTLIAASRGIEVRGVRDGYLGLMAGDFVPLSPDVVGEIHSAGGTILGSARSARFRTPEGRGEALQQLSRAGIDGLVVVGGNGSLTGLAALLDDAGGSLRGIGIPASIDNDVGYTRLAIGVDTAVNTIVDACDKLLDTAGSHGRAFIVEVMGRRCGYLAMAAAVAGGAHAVLFPEAGKDPDHLVDTVLRAIRSRSTKPRNRRCALILKAEGVDVSLETLQDAVTRKIEAEDLGMDVRGITLGHVVRGGRPSAMDRMVATRLGHGAMQGLLSGESGRMVSWASGLSFPPDITSPVSGDPRTCLVDLDAVLEETEAMLTGESSFIAWRSRVFGELEEVFGQ